MSQLSEALRGGRQCDMDGTSVIVSRQACVEAADKLEELEQRIADNERRYNRLDRMHKEASRKLVEERDGLKEQLIAYEAASVVKDMALERIASINLAEYLLPEDFAFRVLQVRKALALQPDDAALNKLEMAEACLAGDNALIAGLKNDLAAATTDPKESK